MKSLIGNRVVQCDRSQRRRHRFSSRRAVIRVIQQFGNDSKQWYIARQRRNEIISLSQIQLQLISKREGIRNPRSIKRLHRSLGIIRFHKRKSTSNNRSSSWNHKGNLLLQVDSVGLQRKYWNHLHLMSQRQNHRQFHRRYRGLLSCKLNISKDWNKRISSWRGNFGNVVRLISFSISILRSFKRGILRIGKCGVSKRYILRIKILRWVLQRNLLMILEKMIILHSTFTRIWNRKMWSNFHLLQVNYK